jgi:hypothetical protein
MSTKTLRKRIALVAVSALGAGLLSVVAVPSANAAAGDIASISGVGLLADANVTTSTGTATLLSTGTLNVVTSAEGGTIVVSSGAYISAKSGTGATLAADQKSGAGDGTNAATFTIVPTGAAGSTFTVTGYTDATKATAVDVLTVTIAGSSVAGVVSPAESTLAWTSTGTPAITDGTDKNKTTVGTGLFLSIQLNDAYAADITSTTGALVVTASSGAYVALGTYNSGTPTQPATSAATYTQAVSGERPSTLLATVKEATVGAGWAGTVTVTYNGVTIGSKTGTITGAPAKITLTNKKIGKSGSNAAALEYQVTDVAGNIVAVTATGLVLSTSSNTAVVSDAIGDGNNSSSAAGTVALTCTSTAGSADVVMQTTLTNGTVVKSSPVAVRCGGAAATYTASFDKAVYAQGEIATLTVSFKDSKGNAANSYDAVSNATPDQVTTVNQMERVTAHAASAKVNASGNIVYTFTVGTASGAIPGKYQALVSFPTLTSPAATQTVAYEISGGAAVSMADVLKSIVSLIASINKQIAALQKALLKK